MEGSAAALPDGGLGAAVGTLMKVKKLTSTLKSKTAHTRIRRYFRALFCQYAEVFGEREQERRIIRAAFDKMDTDGSGFIDSSELRQMTQELGVTMSEEAITGALQSMDENGDDEIEFDEFRDWWVLQGKTHVPLYLM